MLIERYLFYTAAVIVFTITVSAGITNALSAIKSGTRDI